MDANTATLIDDAFTVITGAFTGVAGQIRLRAEGARTILEGDTNGDGVADFSVAINGAITSFDGIIL